MVIRDEAENDLEKAVESNTIDMVRELQIKFPV